MLAQKVGLNNYETAFIEQDYPNHIDEILETSSVKSEAIFGNLIELLKENIFDRHDVVQILQDWINENLTS